MESAAKSQQLCNGILYCLLFYVFPQLPYHYPSGKVEKVYASNCFSNKACGPWNLGAPGFCPPLFYGCYDSVRITLRHVRR